MLVKAQRVTLVIATLRSGGAERNLLRLAEHLSSAGFTTTVMTLNPGVDFYSIPASVHRIHASAEAIRNCRWFQFRCAERRRQALRRELLSTNPDLVISFLDSVNLLVLDAMGETRIPCIVSERIDPRVNVAHPTYRFGRGQRLRRWWLYPRATKVHVVAEAIVPWARRHWPPWRVFSIPNPVPPVPAQVKRGLGDRTVYGMGRLAPQKGFDLLIQAFALVAVDFPAWRLVILGEGPEYDRLSEHARRHGLADRVQLAGAVSDPFPILADASVFVLSSRYEGFPNALTEAMALGLPVISFDCPTGPNEIIRHEHDGLLVPAADVQGLASALRRLMSDEPLRSRLGDRAREVAERFSTDRVMRRWEEEIRDALETDCRPGRH